MAQRIRLTAEVMREFAGAVSQELYYSRTHSALMRLTAMQPHPKADDIEGFPNWRTGLNIYADQTLLLVFEVEAWMNLARATYPDKEDTPRYVGLINENRETLEIVRSLGRKILDAVRPALVEQMELRQERERQQQQQQQQQQEGKEGTDASTSLDGGGSSSSGKVSNGQSGPSGTSDGKESKSSKKSNKKKKGKKKKK